MEIRQKDIAKKVGISASHLSNLLGGKIDMGRKTAKQLSKLCSIPWSIIIEMKPNQLRRIIFAAYKETAK
jgi:transcriptional regulator with XRE-family HTH domain